MCTAVYGRNVKTQRAAQSTRLSIEAKLFSHQDNLIKEQLFSFQIYILRQTRDKRVDFGLRDDCTKFTVSEAEFKNLSRGLNFRRGSNMVGSI